MVGPHFRLGTRVDAISSLEEYPMNTTILIVDDSLVDRHLIGGLLRKRAGWKLEFAEDGSEALDRLSQSTPSLVLTDLVMPRLNGLDLLRKIRKRYPAVPVVLLTAYGNEQIAVDALEEGAASYVPKAQQAERLVETVQRVLARAEANRRRRKIATRLHSASYVYRLESNPALIAPLLDELQQTMVAMKLGDSTERIRTCLAVEEALLNAMTHGNARLAQPLGEVVLSVRLTQDCARFVIRDEGRGFRVQHALGHGLDYYFAEGKSRGMMLLHSVMDEVKFNDAGNEVVLLKTCCPALGT
jgi:CheY-like chemotaxis protein/anti-sigma regulatory factor (Ser/Thr protein kinase)